MKFLCTFFILLISASIYGQNSPLFKTNRSYLSFNASSVLSYKRLIVKNNTPFWKTTKGYWDKINIPKFGWKAEVNYGLKISRRFSAELGFGIKTLGYTINNSNESIFITEDTLSFGIIIKDEGRIDYSFTYLNIPIKIKFLLIDKKIRTHLFIGLEEYFLVDGSIYTLRNKRKQKMYEENLEKKILGALGGLEIQYKLSSKVIVGVTGGYTYSLTPYHKWENIYYRDNIIWIKKGLNEYLDYWGLGISLNYVL